MHKIILFIMVLLWSSASLHAQEKETPNAQQARRMFMETYKMIFGDQGSQLTYNVNIIGIYKAPYGPRARKANS